VYHRYHLNRMAGDKEGLADRVAALDAIRERQSSSYDRALLTLSAGAFSLSLLFYDKIAPHPVQAKGWLVGAWASFVLSIFVVLMAFYESDKAIREQQDAIEEDRAPDGGAEAKIENLNVTAGLAFGIGVVLLFIFATSNLLTGQ